jgi:hypothetical protein
METPHNHLRCAARQFRAAGDALNARETPETTARYRLAFDAVRNARPAEPASIAAQLRWFLEQIGAAPEDAPMLSHAADRLDALAGRAA